MGPQSGECFVDSQRLLPLKLCRQDKSWIQIPLVSQNAEGVNPLHPTVPLIGAGLTGWSHELMDETKAGEEVAVQRCRPQEHVGIELRKALSASISASGQISLETSSLSTGYMISKSSPSKVRAAE
ncbi:hypothetical protein NQZ68_008089 [Dissostichus eleginoides]|nr:hypothetical protein NQZ68_008089 [Dissostichus eleginoides]